VNQRADRPSISVIVPALNEAATIRRAISPLLADPLAVDLEVIVAVGPSTDETREVLMEMADRDARIRLLDNPARITPEGLNAAIRASQGSVILRMDGHAEPDPGYVSACLDALKNSGAWNVGGRIRKVGLTSAARAAAAATSSPFGVGGGKRFHLLSEPQYVDTLWPGCWPRWVFERVGLFDPEMVQNQDDEFNQRIIEAGGTIRFEPTISAAYISRASWHGLVRQYFRYGMYKVRGIQKRPRLLRPRHLVPAIMVASAVGTLLLGMLTPWGLLAFGLESAAWLAAAIFFGRRVAPTYGATLFGMVVAYACLHVSYGLGTWVGLVRFGRRWFTDRAGSVPRLDPLDSLTTPTPR
jgi:glycosyltransferase involved in cell wall biosynthesis